MKKVSEGEVEVDLYNTNRVFLFMNVPTKGGIIEHINCQAKFFKSLGKEVYFISEGYKQIPKDELYNLEYLDVDYIYNMEKNENFSEIIKDGSLLLFTQVRIAKEFVNFFENNKVIVQYHRNINDATDSVLRDLKFLQNALIEGEIQFLEPQESIDREINFSGIKEFKNYIFPPKKTNSIPVNKVKNIGYISRLTDNDNAKNIDGVLRIINKTIKLNPEVSFHIYGEGDKKGLFENIGENVILHGFLYDKDEIYRDLDLVILPSVSEAYPMVLVEAISYGVKVVSYENTNMIRNIITPQVGKVISLNNEDEFAKEIATFSSYDREDVLKYSKNKFFFNRETMSTYMTTVKKGKYRKNKIVYFYDYTLKENIITLDFFSNGYFLDTEEVFVGSTIPYKKYGCKDSSPDLYSKIAYNFRRQFFTLEFNINKFKKHDFIKLYKNNRLATISITRKGSNKIPLGEGKFIILEDNEFSLGSSIKEKN